MTWILLIATAGVLGMLAVSVRRAQTEIAEQRCDCLHREPLPVDVVPPRRRAVRRVENPSGLRPAG